MPKILPTSSSGTDRVIVVSGSNTSGVSPAIAGGAFLAARLLLPTSRKERIVLWWRDDTAVDDDDVD